MDERGNRLADAHAAAVADLRARQADALAELRRREILDTACRLFARQGYHQTSIADIAGTLAIGHGTVYCYFKSKRQILDRIVDDLVGRFLATAVAENAPDAATNLAEYRAQVERFADAFWTLLDSEPEVRMLLRQADSVDSELVCCAGNSAHNPRSAASAFFARIVRILAGCRRAERAARYIFGTKRPVRLT